MRMMIALGAIGLIGAVPPPSDAVRIERAMVDADPAPTKASASGGYVRLTSVGRDDVLLGARCHCAGDVDLHRIVRAPKPDMLVKQTLPLKADTATDIAPGSDWHVWVGDLNRPLIDGQTVSIVLKFEKAGEVPVPFAIRADTKAAWKAFDEKR